MATLQYNIKGKYDGKAIKDAKTDLNGIKNNSNSATTSLMKIGKVGAVVGVATMAIKKLSSEVLELRNIYKVQEIAELKLSKAIENNPLIDGKAVKGLKEYASYLQSVSNIGDETSISIMANLSAMGRTEKEIREIMSAAIDMSAGTGQSLEQVAKNLSKTYNGMAGEIGESVKGIKELTKEELEHGKAVEIVAKAYKGMAEETADAQIQLKNAWGDTKELLGGKLNGIVEPILVLLTNILTAINKALSKTNEVKQQTQAEVFGYDKLTTEELEKIAISLTEEINKNTQAIEENKYNYHTAEELTQLQKEFAVGLSNNIVENMVNQANENTGSDYRIDLEKSNEDLTAQIKAVNEELKRRKTEAETTKNNKTKSINETAKEIKDNLAKEIKAIFEKSEIGNSNVYKFEALENAIDLIDKAIKESNGVLTERNAELREWQKKLNDLVYEEEKNQYKKTEDDNTIDTFKEFFADIGKDFNFKEGYTGLFTGSAETMVVSALIENLNLLSNTIKLLHGLSSPFITILQGVLQGFDHIAESALPIIDFLTDIGQVLGSALGIILTPLLWVADGLSYFTEGLKKAIAGVSAFVKFIGTPSKWKKGGLKDLYNEELKSMNSSSSTDLSNNGSVSVSATAPRDVYITINYNNSFVNGDAREIAIQIKKEIQMAEKLGY
jgi:hypothetical protein